MLTAQVFFAGKEKLPGGIYFIVSPKKEILFELLIDKEQKFSISADTAGLPASVVFTGSPDNTAFQSYTKTMATDGKEMAGLQSSYAKAVNHEDSTAILDKMKALNVQIRDYRTGLEKKYPESLLTMLLKALKEPIVPPADQQPGGKYDTAYAFNYYRSHYWDEISWTDDRLVRTPILEAKLDRYYKEVVPQQTDTLNREVDMMLLQSRTNKEMFKFLMVYFVQKYINPNTWARMRSLCIFSKNLSIQARLISSQPNTENSSTTVHTASWQIKLACPHPIWKWLTVQENQRPCIPSPPNLR